jgi:segregation and condensation protein A
MDALRKIMLDVLKRIPEPPRIVIRRDVVTLAQTLAGLRERLRSAGRFSFREAISACRTRVEVVLAFLAVLELLKAGECDAAQDEAWGDIQVIALAAV